MSVLGILTCEILELEFANLLGSDPEVVRITVLEDERSARLIETLESLGIQDLWRISDLEEFTPDPEARLEVLVRVLELALHLRKKTLQEGLTQGALALNPHVDALVLGYGLCGNAIEKPDELLSEVNVPIFIPMDTDHPVDDCVGLVIGGRESYYAELRKVAGTFFMTPGWTYHWRRLLQQEFGGVSLELAKRMFAHYERSLLILTPLLSEDEMEQNVEEFNNTFGFRAESREGTLHILEETWRAAKESLAGSTAANS
jgi:hypothetical protein